MNPARDNACPACTGKGWLILFNTDSEALELQRCDACGRFPSDEDARRHVASSKTCIVLALHELCSGLLAEAGHAPNANPTNIAAERTLAAFRRSLRNAVALGREAISEDLDTP